MKKLAILVVMFLPVFMLDSCWAKPTRLVNFPGPSSDIAYTVEVWEETGAISSDFTRVSVIYTHGGDTDKQTFLDGAYLQVAGVRWDMLNQATICLSEGRINSFKEQLVLRAGGAAYRIANRINWHCPAPK